MADQLSRPRGDITTLLDLAPRDEQDANFFPLSSEVSWFQPQAGRTLHPFSMSIQQFPIRGPAAWGQRVTFDLGSVNCGDLLVSTVLQIQLGHWFDLTTVQNLLQQAYGVSKDDIDTWWFYANSLGTTIIERAELEIGDTTIESIDGDFIHVFSSIFPSLNTQVGLSQDAFGRVPIVDLRSRSASPLSTPFDSTITPDADYWAPQPWPTERGLLMIPLPFFYQRVKLAEALPLLSIREGSVRIHITFRSFKDCVRQFRGFRESCDATPLSHETQLWNLQPSLPYPDPIPLKAYATPPSFRTIQLVTYAAVTDGMIRQALLRRPFEILHRQVTCIHFAEPLKYTVTTSDSDTIKVNLPLELNHPIEEIIWFVRRKDVSLNNEWTNTSAVLTRHYDPTYSPFTPMLQRAKLQINGIEIIDREEEWFRSHIASHHKGGIVAYNSFIYGYSFARSPGVHQPSGTINASRAQSIRLTLDVKSPLTISPMESKEWEVKVFVIGLQWLRFQEGLANRMFQS